MSDGNNLFDEMMLQSLAIKKHAFESNGKHKGTYFLNR